MLYLCLQAACRDVRQVELMGGCDVMWCAGPERSGGPDRAQCGSGRSGGGGEDFGERVGDGLQRDDGQVRGPAGVGSDRPGEGGAVRAAERGVGGRDGADDAGHRDGEAGEEGSDGDAAVRDDDVGKVLAMEERCKKLVVEVGHRLGDRI